MKRTYLGYVKCYCAVVCVLYKRKIICILNNEDVLLVSGGWGGQFHLFILRSKKGSMSLCLSICLLCTYVGCLFNCHECTWGKISAPVCLQDQEFSF